MSAVGDLVVRLGLNQKGFSRGLATAQARLHNFSSGIGSIMGRMGRLVAMGGTLVGVGGALAGVGFGIKLAAQAEQAEVAFGTLLGNADLARKVLKDLSDFAASTPFQLADLRTGAQQLLAFGVAQEDLMDRLRMLGDIAAGTGKPIADFVDIFGKVKASGVAAMGDINRLADRGVPIFRTLAETMGVPQSEIRKLVSTGKVGFEQLKRALEVTTEAGGVFAGGMEKQSRTVIGLFSTLKDNIGFALQEIGQAIIDGFDFKTVMNDAITFIQTVKGHIITFVPVIKQAANVIIAQWTATFNLLSDLIGLVFGKGGMSVIEWRDLIFDGLAVVEFAFMNWQKIAELALLKVALGFVSLGNDISHFFTGVLPALFDWFLKNWKEIFHTAFDFAATVFIQLGKNIRNAMSSIWEFIKSGGTKSLKISWQPLTEGFVNTIRQLPDIPKRELGALEKQLLGDVSRLGKELDDGLGEHLNKRRLELVDSGAKDTIDAIVNGPAKPERAVGAPSTAEKEQVDTGIQALQKGSVEAFNKLIRAGSGASDPAKKNVQQNNVMIAGQKAMSGVLKVIEKNTASLSDIKVVGLGFEG